MAVSRSKRKKYAAVLIILLARLNTAFENDQDDELAETGLIYAQRLQPQMLFEDEGSWSIDQSAAYDEVEAFADDYETNGDNINWAKRIEDLGTATENL